VTVVSAPAGSGKSVLLRSWIGAAGLAGRAGWVAVRGQERDPQRFWLSVADALRGTAGAAARVRPVTAAPDLDGWAIVGRLLEDLGGLPERVWLVVDDLHELRSAEALRQLELLVTRAPPELRFLLATRQDLRLGLHGLRLEGELTEIRAADLRFTVDEARALLDAAGVRLPEWALALLVERTEGWAAGLRLAAQSLAGHPDPERAAAEFCGSERTVSDYLLAEVLERLDEEARRLLLRTSVLEWVPGPLAGVLTGNPGAERILQDLEQAGAFVVSLNMRRSVFRYHRLFAELLQLELRRTEPALIHELHSTAAGWLAEHGHPVEAIRHAQAAQDWNRAARLLSDQWLRLVLGGRGGFARELLARFPAGFATDPELAALRGADELDGGSLEQAGRYLTLAGHRSASVPEERRERLEVMRAVLRLRLARQGGDLPAVVGEAQRLLAPGEAGEASGMSLRALALISLGTAELWAARLEEAQGHLEQGAALARRIGQPYLEVNGRAHLALVTHFRSFPLSAKQGRQVIELAWRHGWTDDPAVAIAYMVLGAARFWPGDLHEADLWLKRAEQALRSEVEPAAGMLLHLFRGELEMALGHDAEALAVFQAAMPLADLLATPHPLAARMRARMVHAQVRLGDTVRADAALAGMGPRDRESQEMRIVLAELRLAQDNPQAATAALEPVLGSSAPGTDSRGSPAHASPVQAIAADGLGGTADSPGWVVQAWLAESIAREALGDTAAAEDAAEQALSFAGSGDVLVPFLLNRAPELLKRHARHCSSHAALIGTILDMITQGPGERGGSSPGKTALSVSDAEIRVLRYLPSDLTVPEIARQLSLSVNTVRTHMRHIYDKLHTHHRRDVVQRASALGLLSRR